MYITPRKLASENGVVHERFPLSTCLRLREQLFDDDGSAEVNVVFSYDDEGRIVFEGALTATLKMACQRCLQPFSFEVNAQLCAAVVYTEDAMRQLPAHVEPLLAEDERVDFLPFLEDEFLLGLPVVPHHEEGQCPDHLYCQPQGEVLAVDDAEPIEEKRENPFSVLAGLCGREQ